MSHRQLPSPPRRRALPYVALVAVVAVAAVALWVVAFTRTGETTQVACARPETGVEVSSTGLLGEVPAPPSAIPVRVLNANGEAGEATEVSEGLVGLGFTRAPDNPVGNDPLVPDQDLECYGQIRFGTAFAAHGATLHALIPCLELSDDGREDGSVDGALGRGFGGLDDSGPVRAAMSTLNSGGEVDAATLQSMNSLTC